MLDYNPSGDTGKLMPFELNVSNTSKSEVLCGDYDGEIRLVYNVTCAEPAVGSYVHFIRKNGGNKPLVINLCEIIIIGHQYIG